MKRIEILLAAFVLWSSIFVDPMAAANLAPIKGGVLPSIRLPIPKDPVEKTYLGLSGDGSFTIAQTRAEVVIIEIFGLYCPQCHKIAPEVKKLYENIDNDPDLKDKIKLIGIGAGNSFYEVEVYRKMHETPFPLFPDKDFAIHEAFGNVRTPYFVAIRINDDRTHEVFYSEAGGFGEAGAFLESIIAGLRPKP